MSLLAALALGCGECPGGTAPATSEARTVVAEPAEAPIDDAQGPDGFKSPDGFPPTGSVRLRLAGNGITLQATAAPRRDLLEMLARELGFELQAPDLDNEPVTALADRESLADLLPQLLPDRAYRLDYRVAPGAAAHAVARLEIAAHDGRFATAVGVSSNASGDRTPGSVADASTPTRDPGAVDWKQLLLRLDDSDADERIEALDEIDPDGDGLTLIADRLARDPDPRVRVVAARKLELSDTLAAVDALVVALEDTDKSVVLAAIEALEFTDDVTVVNDLAPLLQHPDAEVRDTALRAIDFIRDDD